MVARIWKPGCGSQDLEKNDSRRRFVDKGSGELEKNDSRRRFVDKGSGEPKNNDSRRCFVDKGSGELPSRSGLKGCHKRRCL